jgi:hypothetical protein
MPSSTVSSDAGAPSARGQRIRRLARLAGQDPSRGTSSPATVRHSLHLAALARLSDYPDHREREKSRLNPLHIGASDSALPSLYLASKVNQGQLPFPHDLQVLRFPHPRPLPHFGRRSLLRSCRPRDSPGLAHSLPVGVALQETASLATDNHIQLGIGSTTAWAPWIDRHSIERNDPRRLLLVKVEALAART